jgi:hypothetical protein
MNDPPREYPDREIPFVALYSPRRNGGHACHVTPSRRYLGRGPDACHVFNLKQRLSRGKQTQPYVAYEPGPSS